MVLLQAGTSGGLGSIYLTVPSTGGGIATGLAVTTGVLSLASSGNVDISSQSSGAINTRLSVGGLDSTSLIGYSGTLTSLYSESSAVLVGGSGSIGFTSVMGAGSVYVGGTNWAALTATGGSSVSAATAVTAASGTVSVSGAFVRLGSTAPCSPVNAAGGAGTQCSSGGGQVIIPNSGLVLSSINKITCSGSSPTTLTLADIMSYGMVVIDSSCTTGWVFILPTIPSSNYDGTHITFIYDQYNTGPVSSYYVTLQHQPDIAFTQYMQVKVASRTAVTLVVFPSAWSGAPGSSTVRTYAVVGGADQALTSTPYLWQ